MAANDLIKAEDIFRKAVGLGCSDIHIKVGSPPKMRRNGLLVAIPGYETTILEPRQTDLLAAQTMDSHALASFQHNKYGFDYAYEIKEIGRFRMNASKTRGATQIVARLLASKAKTLDELEVPSAVKQLAKSKTGVIIVSGATGSGKSSTMAGIIDLINTTKPVNIISIEDPIEIVHIDAMASISQREVGVDVENYESALTSALRQDPDVILIGEVRTLETLKTVLVAADTGHLVITTLHTTDTAEAINKMITFFPSEERDNTRRALASVLRGIVGQRLVPNLRGDRTVATEILINTPEIADAILAGSPAKEIKQIIAQQKMGMQTFEQGLADLVRKGVIDVKTAEEFSVNPEYFETVDLTPVGKPKSSELSKPPVTAPIGVPANLHRQGIPPQVPQQKLPTAPPNHHPVQTKRHSNPFT